MYIPVLSKRKGGGGRGGGGYSSGGRSTSSSSKGSSKGSSSSSSSKSGSKGSTVNRPPAYSPGAPPPPYSVSGGSAVRGYPGGYGGGSPYTVRDSGPFSGRLAGGGSRAGVYGAGAGLGAGYLLGHSSFPYIFWPLSYGGPYNNHYGTGIYGPPSNDTRPGGALLTWTLVPQWAANQTNGAVGPQNNTFALYGDVSSVSDLIPALASACGVLPNAYGQNLTATPEMAVEYYRGSSFTLLLQDYNNTLPLINATSDDQSALPDSVRDAVPAPLPSGVNMTYFNCLNSTIGSQIGLLDAQYAQDNAAGRSTSAAGLQALAALVLVAWSLL